MSIKQHIEGMCTFQYYKDSELWYKTQSGLMFNVPFNVPITDISNATFNYQEKGLLMMRYIRKYLAMTKIQETSE